MNNSAQETGQKQMEATTVDSPYPEEFQKFWMQTHSGVQFRPYACTPEMIKFDDIVHALSNIARYNGHTDQHYSVAQHSVYVSYCVPIEFAYVALMHDAVEAYIGDMAAPVKWGQPGFNKLEQYIWEAAIAPRFGLPLEMPPEVKTADLALLVYEQSHLVKDFGHDWGLDHLEVPDLPKLVPNFGLLPDGSTRLGPRGMPKVTPRQAEAMFRKRAIELQYILQPSRL